MTDRRTVRDEEVSKVQRRRLTALVVVLLSVAMIVAACGKSKKTGGATSTTSAAKVKVGGTVPYAADQQPTGFNLNTSKDNGTAVLNVMDRVWPSVFHANPKIEVVLDKDLMESADLTKTDPETITYKINPKAVWSDGTPINADDFIYAWTMQKGGAKDIDGKPADVAATTGYEDIESVTGSDNGETVTVVFKNKFSDWKSLFSIMVPAHIGKVKGWNNGFDKFDPAVVVSGGPFKIQSWNQDKDLTLVPNDKYWGKRPNLDQVVYRFITESSQQVPALQNKEVDMIYPQPQLDTVSQVKQIPDVNGVVNFGLSFEHLDFNFKNPILGGTDGLTVRKAFAMALDRPAIVQRTVAQFDPKAAIDNNRIYVNNQHEYVDNGRDYASADVAGAKKALEAAGFALGSDGIYAKGGKRLSFSIRTTQGNQLREQQLQLIQAQEKLAGIELTPNNAKSNILFKQLPQGQFDISNFGWVDSPFPSGNKSIYTTNSDSNYGKYSNPKVDDLFKQAVAELDDTKKKDLYNQIDKILWDDMVTIPLYQKPTFIAYRNTLANVGDNPTNEGPFWNEELWGFKAAAL